MADVKKRKIAVILFNLGGPDSLEAVKPFLFNLFNDRNIINIPQPLRWMLATLISIRRAPIARKIYAQIGGKSPIVAETNKQADALQAHMRQQGYTQVRCFTVMRYWFPRLREVLREVHYFEANHIVLLPLYPQFSTTTTRSSLQEWKILANYPRSSTHIHEIGCFPDQPDFIAAHAALIREHAPYYFGPDANAKARLLFSAHGLPQKIVDKGDPYPQQIIRTASAIAASLGLKPQDWEICYQSRVGPLQWLGPSTESRLVAAGKAGIPVVLAPIAFVSEHSETLVELDIEYRHLAAMAGVPAYIRIPALGSHADFIRGLGNLVENALSEQLLCGQPGEKLCCLKQDGQ